MTFLIFLKIFEEFSPDGHYDVYTRFVKNWYHIAQVTDLISSIVHLKKFPPWPYWLPITLSPYHCIIKELQNSILFTSQSNFSYLACLLSLRRDNLIQSLIPKSIKKQFFSRCIFFKKGNSPHKERLSTSHSNIASRIAFYPYNKKQKKKDERRRAREKNILSERIHIFASITRYAFVPWSQKKNFSPGSDMALTDLSYIPAPIFSLKKNLRYFAHFFLNLKRAKTFFLYKP